MKNPSLFLLPENPIRKNMYRHQTRTFIIISHSHSKWLVIINGFNLHWFYIFVFSALKRISSSLRYLNIEYITGKIVHRHHTYIEFFFLKKWTSNDILLCIFISLSLPFRAWKSSILCRFWFTFAQHLRHIRTNMRR